MFISGLAGEATPELAMTLHSAPRRRESVRLVEQAGDVLHPAGDKRKNGQGDQQEKQKHACRIGQGKQQRPNQNGKYCNQELDGGHAQQNKTLKTQTFIDEPRAARLLSYL